MSPQGVTRKRPAPGTPPLVHPQIGPASNYPAPNPGTQLSNDQFLQWGQNPPTVMTPPYTDVGSYNLPAYSTNQEIQGSAPAASTQIARRQLPNQLVNRGRGYEQTTANYPEHGVTGGEAGAWGESLDELYRRAMVAKREAQAKRKQIPPFVQKLSSFLDESKNTDLIRWSDDGNSFIVLDEDEFAKTLIPELFKHNNYASFVRQLNMYGFHKKVGLSDNSMRASERKNKSPSEYANPYFKRGHPDLLWLIQKPKNTAGQGSKTGKGNVRVKTEEVDDNEGDEYGEDGASRDDRNRSRQLSLVPGSLMPKDQLAGVYRELQAIRQQQQIISNTISKLRREHEQLYAQAANFQEQHNRHENSINAILTFLATVYNRSLQGSDGTQNLANSFAGVISQDQGNVVDMGDNFPLSALGAANMNSPSTQRTLKKQPLLLKAPPVPERHGRATTLSPAASSYDRSQSRNHSRQPSVAQPGHVEEVFETSPRPKGTPPSQTQQHPQRDIMSAIHNSNAQNGIPTTFADFPNVLSSLETSGGNSPLTPNQRADMLRLMANETHNDANIPVPTNSALITPTPPPMPLNYSGRLANTRAEIDNLMKMQAEQDRSVQNLTNLLQPLSPNGSIPGIASENGGVPPPPLDLDALFNNDYFTDIGDLEHNKNNLNFGDSTSSVPPAVPAEPPVPTGVDDLKDGSDLFDFDQIPAEADLFDPPAAPDQTTGFFHGYDGTGYSPIGGASPQLPIGNKNHNMDSGRIVETITDSEATSPSGTVDEAPQYNGASGASDSQGGKGYGGNAKRRRKA
ncbi:heat shock factor family protein [Aspergillus clavatus NRRL 1]|uniref:Heat shock transcription factor (Hsf) n=1 Tax=Aspergillus clavatus (strain ATCC 1007 / CBS 513.65 / DSM 816 / NCTC 3887 / NRRL 1 / QM 1276 / 107) TaxID=344612 RepID=A1C5F5_ASPCL|nr:heat shock transcription factor (hsf) [Aspergillus clavatus NRRL 1]EAW14923.1 heat shock transcription factor (hsf) [Aspergillus clavatus NRRL 1]